MKFDPQGMISGLVLGVIIAIPLAIGLGNILPHNDSNCENISMICNPHPLTWIISIGQWIALTLWLSFKSNDRPKIDCVLPNLREVKE